MRAVVLLAALCGLAAAAPVITSEQFHSLRPESTGLQQSPCDYCQDLVRTVDEFISDPQTQQAGTEYLDAVVCSALPKDFRDVCKQEVPVLVTSAAQQVSELLAPADVCGMVGACPGAAPFARLAAAQAAQEEATPFDCPVCKLMVAAFVQRLQDRQSRAEIESAMHGACANLEDPAAQARCTADVADLFAALDRLLHDVDPAGACAMFDFCGGDLGARPAAPPALRALRSAAGRLASTPRGGPANDYENCDSCKAIVSEAAAILTDPKTQADLLDYAKQGCTLFQDFKDQCEAYVTLYGPLVLNMLLTYLQPAPLCARLGYCPAPPPPTVAA